MKKLFKTVFGLSVFTLLLGGWALAGSAVHVVLSPGSCPGVGRVTIVPKDRMTYRQTFTDTRNWAAADLAHHSALVARLLEAGKADVIHHVMPVSAASATSMERGLMTTGGAAELN